MNPLRFGSLPPVTTRYLPDAAYSLVAALQRLAGLLPGGLRR
jgi:hypothetical protein